MEKKLPQLETERMKLLLDSGLSKEGNSMNDRDGKSPSQQDGIDCNVHNRPNLFLHIFTGFFSILVT